MLSENEIFEYIPPEIWEQIACYCDLIMYRNLLLTSKFLSAKFTTTTRKIVIMKNTKTIIHHDGTIVEKFGNILHKIFPNGNEEWYKNDQLHRTDFLPAVTTKSVKYWYYQGYLHRDDGEPAVTYANGRKEWYIYGTLIQVYNQLTNEIIVYDTRANK